MQRLFSYINNNVLLKVIKLHNANIITKILAGILTSKAIAILIGVEGMALIGNMRSFFKAIQSLAVLGLYNGLVKYIAEFKNDAVQLSKTLSTAYYLGFFTTIFLSLICYYSADSINNFLFSANYNYTSVIKILAFALPFYALNMFSYSIMNGFSKYRILMIINIIGQILGLLITLLLIYQNRLEGALIAVVIAPSLMFLITLVGIVNRKSYVPQIKISNVDFDILKKFMPYMLMALASIIAMPIIYIIIRNYIIDTIGVKFAGYWEAMNRISDYYLMFVSSLMTLYVIPKFRDIKTRKEFKNEIKNLYKSILPVFLLGLLVIYLLRSLIVQLVFSKAFQPVEDLFLWQLLGDLIKILAIVIAYQFIAKKMFIHFVVIELFLVIVVCFSSVYLIDIFGVKGAVLGHFISYILYFGIVFLVYNKSLIKIIPE